MAKNTSPGREVPCRLPSLLVLAFGAVANWLMERRRALSGVERLEGWLQERITQIACNDGEFAREALLRQHFAELCQGYLDCHGSILAILPPGRWHLEIRGYFRLCLQPPPAALPSTPRPLLERFLAPDRALPEVASIDHLSQFVATGQRWRLGLLEDASVGVLAAGLWGEVLYANTAMHKVISRSGELGQLNQVLMALTGLSLATVMERLRGVVAEGSPWRFETQAQHGQPATLFELARWEPSHRLPGEDAVPWRLVLTSVPRHPACERPEAAKPSMPRLS